MSMEFNDLILTNNLDFVSIYSLFGPNPDPKRYTIDPRECEDADCLHPCYGKLGECNKCANHFLKTGERHSICDDCQILPSIEEVMAAVNEQMRIIQDAMNQWNRVMKW